MTESNLVNTNTADEEALAQIPGVGEEMAKRIIDKRPFTSLEDLERVNGIGPVFLENIAPYITLSPEGAQAETSEADKEETTVPEAFIEGESASDEQAISPDTENVSVDEDQPIETDVQIEREILQPEVEILGEEESAVPDIEPSDEEEVPPSEKTPHTEVVPIEPTPPMATRSQVFWMSCASSVLAFILALAIILGILASLNGGLRFATPSQVRGVSNQLEGLSSQFDILAGDLDGLRTRLDNLEGLSGRVEIIETTTEKFESDLGTMSAQIDDMSQQVDGLATQVDDLEAQVAIMQEQTSRFQGFFEGMRDLLTNLFPGEVTK